MHVFGCGTHAQSTVFVSCSNLCNDRQEDASQLTALIVSLLCVFFRPSCRAFNCICTRIGLTTTALWQRGKVCTPLRHSLMFAPFVVVARQSSCHIEYGNGRKFKKGSIVHQLDTCPKQRREILIFFTVRRHYTNFLCGIHQSRVIFFLFSFSFYSLVYRHLLRPLLRQDAN